MAKLDELKNLIGTRKLIVFGEVPGAGIPDAAGCFLRPKWLGADYCGSMLTSPRNENHALEGNAMFAKYAAARAGVELLDPFDALCDQTSCRAFQGGRVLYSDVNHLSKEGSKVVVEHFKSWLLGKLS